MDSDRLGKAREIEDRLLRDRILFIGTPIDDFVASRFLADVKQLAERRPASPIKLYLNTPGGSFDAGWKIVKEMAALKAEVRTWCIGQASGIWLGICQRSVTIALRFWLRSAVWASR